MCLFRVTLSPIGDPSFLLLLSLLGTPLHSHLFPNPGVLLSPDCAQHHRLPFPALLPPLCFTTPPQKLCITADVPQEEKHLISLGRDTGKVVRSSIWQPQDWLGSGGAGGDRRVGDHAGLTLSQLCRNHLLRRVSVRTRCLLSGVSVRLQHASAHRCFPQSCEVRVTIQLVSHAQISHTGDLFSSAESPAWVRTRRIWHQRVSVPKVSCVSHPGVQLRPTQQTGPQVQFNSFLPTLQHSQHRTGPGHFTSSSTSQVLNGLPLVINLPWTKPLVCKGSKALAKPPSLFPKLTSKLGEVLASLRLVAKRSHKVVLLHSDPIMQESNFPVYPPVPEHQLSKLLLEIF